VCNDRWLSICVQSLILNDNALRDLGGANNSGEWLAQLTELDLSNNYLAAVPAALVAATSLRQLHMQHQRNEQ
jgi:Leucine-rich repeat (LRR) protein